MKHMLTVDYIEFCLLTYNILVIYNYFGYATLLMLILVIMECSLTQTYKTKFKNIFFDYLCFCDVDINILNVCLSVWPRYETNPYTI